MFLIVCNCLASFQILITSLFSCYKLLPIHFSKLKISGKFGNFKYWIHHYYSLKSTCSFLVSAYLEIFTYWCQIALPCIYWVGTIIVHGSVLGNRFCWFVLGHNCYIYKSEWGKMELSCIRMRNWVGEGLVVFLFSCLDWKVCFTGSWSQFK